jgi:multidrug resistance efflux pump
VPTARFQAAAAIREAAIREWAFLNADHKRTLISFCLCYAMQHATSPDAYVQAKVSSVAAQLMKRGW